MARRLPHLANFAFHFAVFRFALCSSTSLSFQTPFPFFTPLSSFPRATGGMPVSSERLDMIVITIQSVLLCHHGPVGEKSGAT